MFIVQHESLKLHNITEGLVQVFTKFTGRGRSCHVLGVGSMPSTVRWTYKGEKVEHHGEQRIELDLNSCVSRC